METLFIHGRPLGPPSHIALLESINADFVFSDRLIRYQDDPQAASYRKYVSWIVNSFSLAERRKYDLFVTQGVHFGPVFAKRMGLIRPDQKLAALLSYELLYFLDIGYLGRTSTAALLWALRSYDALICLSKYQADLARKLLGSQCPMVYQAKTMISQARFERYIEVRPKLTEEKILFIANGPDGWRRYYKGIDLLFRTFKLVAERFPNATLTIIGQWDDRILEDAIGESGCPRDRVRIMSKTDDLESYLSDSDLYLHLANGEAFGVTVTEAMAAGLPAIVSTETGAKEALSDDFPAFIVPTNEKQAADQVIKYFELSPDERRVIGEKMRFLAAPYSEDVSIQRFREVIDELAGQ